MKTLPVVHVDIHQVIVGWHRLYVTENIFYDDSKK